MRRFLYTIYCSTINLVPLILLLWKYLPPFSPTLEVLLSSQTVRLIVGMFLMLPGLLCVFVSRKVRFYTGLSAILSALLISQTMSYASGIKRDSFYPASKPKLTIYSQNVLYNAPCSRDLVKIVQELSPDLAVFQEYDSSHAVIIGPHLKALGYEETVVFSAPTDGAFAFAVYSKLPVRNHEIFYTEGPEWKPRWPNQYFEFLFDGQWIKVVNLHLVPPHNPLEGVYPYPPQQKYIPWQLREVFRRAGEGEIPALICGDFNLTPSAKYLIHLQDAFTDSWRESGGGFGATWHNPFPLFRIDYIFHSRHLRTLECWTIGNNFSDHRGMMAVVVSD